MGFFFYFLFFHLFLSFLFLSQAHIFLKQMEQYIFSKLKQSCFARHCPQSASSHSSHILKAEEIHFRQKKPSHLLQFLRFTSSSSSCSSSSSSSSSSSPPSSLHKSL